MAPPIALQLYTMREALAKDFAGTLRRIAVMGYVGVETAGFPEGVTPRAAKRLLDDLGLAVCGAHSPLPLGDKKNEVLEAMAALGCARLVCAWQPPEHFKSADGIRRACAILNEANTLARDNGLTFGYHNHWWEFLPVEGDGRRAYQVMLEHLSPEVFLEIDTYWIKTAGADPAAVLRELGGRAPLLHIKDGPAAKDAPMTAVGDGVMDFAAIARASAAEWWIVELDDCATDMLEAVEKSYRYLAGKGLARGRN